MVALLRSKVCDDPNAEFQEFWQAIDEQNPEQIEEKFKPNFWNLPGPGKSGINSMNIYNRWSEPFVYELLIATKGQLISKCPYEKSVWTKYQQKYF